MRQSVVAVLLLFVVTAWSKSATVTFNGVNTTIWGTITFTQATEADNVTISVNLTGLPANHTYHVHQFAATAGGAVCDNSVVSGHFNPYGVDPTLCAAATDKASVCEVGDLSGKHGVLVGPTVEATFDDGNLTLFGELSIIDRSVVIHTGSPRIACGTIVEDGDIVELVSTFNGDGLIAGKITFRQNSLGGDTSIETELWRTDGQTVLHPWHVHVSPVWPTLFSNDLNCTNTGGHFNPTGLEAAGNCTSATTYAGRMAACEIGGLAQKFGSINISTRGAFKYHFTDQNLPLTGSNNIRYSSIVIHDAVPNNGVRVGCANIGRVVVARFYGLGDNSTNSMPRGVAVFSQPHVSEPVTVDITLDGILYGGANGNPIHVHQLPVADSCGSTGGHFDPFGAVARAGGSASYWCNSSTVDKANDCEMGDLSGKFGPIVAGVRYLHTDPDLTLFGANSIVGRSVVVHRATDSENYTSAVSRYACATLHPLQKEKVVTATFLGPVTGTITLRQTISDPLAGTTVLVRVKYTDAAAATTTNNYHVHVNRITADDWNTVAGHYNPWLINASRCATSTSKGKDDCEVGDLAGKHGALSLSNTTSAVFYTDLNLPLTGPNSVSGRSIVIHNSGATTKLAAASLGFEARAIFSNASGPVGYIHFFQPSADDLTTISVNLTGLAYQGTNGNGYHIHQLPPLTDSCTSTGPHYDPMAVGTTNCVLGSTTLCELGDLSGKHGLLVNASVSIEYTDAFVPLSGLYSVVGRGLVIHKASTDPSTATNNRYACTTINHYPATPLTQQVAYFNGPQVYGYIRLSQKTGFPDSETTILAALRRTLVNATAATFNHNWHVHQSPPSGACSTTGPHHNPWAVDPTVCAGLAPSLKAEGCEIGDQSGKVGILDLPTTLGYSFWTDPNLPLSGALSALNRGITIHAEERASARFVCAGLEAQSCHSTVASDVCGVSPQCSFCQFNSMCNTVAETCDCTILADFSSCHAFAGTCTFCNISSGCLAASQDCACNATTSSTTCNTDSRCAWCSKTNNCGLVDAQCGSSAAVSTGPALATTLLALVSALFVSRQ